MPKITFRSKGNFSKTDRYFQKILKAIHLGILDRYGRKGVNALSSATPIDSGETAASWYYTTSYTEDSASLIFSNSHINKGVPIAIILQYGHGTGTGGYVQGRDYINPAIQPIFDNLASEAWKEVTSL